MRYGEFVRLRLLAIVFVVPFLFAVGTAVDGGSGWGWWLTGALAWLGLWCFVLLRVYRRQE
ncbi:hypothetical protein [Phycicoccus sonneratiae]|uniref:Uncharacterized protein n=1 Tax=Phycicoccus sonneratiae TaxID=2807628 RepID=A0ABS2CIS1_9MICO|nr:hypothetical protein [Phycicoccus sonneraticus]MBM6399787.1 hypothetical protein [Phycicoccus sonneraticus]